MNHPYMAWPIYDTVDVVKDTKFDRELIYVKYRKVAEICAFCSWRKHHPDHSGQGSVAR